MISRISLSIILLPIWMSLSYSPIRMPSVYRTPLWRNQKSHNVECFSARTTPRHGLVAATRFGKSNELVIQHIPFKDGDSQHYLVFHPTMDRKYKFENMHIVSMFHILVIAWHKDLNYRVLLQLQIRSTKWEFMELARLDHSACVHISQKEDTGHIRLVFYSGLVLTLDSTGKVLDHHLLHHGVLVHAEEENVVMVGDGSSRLDLLLRKDDGWEVLAQIDHATVGASRIRSGCIQKITHGFVGDQCAMYQVMTMDDHLRLYEWEIRIFPSKEQMRVDCIWNGFPQYQPTGQYEASYFRTGMTKRMLYCQTRPSVSRVFLNEPIASQNSFLECRADNRRNPVFFQHGRVLICMHGSTMDVWDLDMGQSRLVEAFVPSDLTTTKKDNGCAWYRAPLQEKPNTTPTNMQTLYMQMHEFITNNPSP